MNNILYLIFLFLAIILIKFLLNISKYFYLKKVIKKHNIFLDGELAKEDEQKKREGIEAGNWIQENQIEIKNVVSKTGLHDQKKSYMQSLGLGYAQQQNVSALDNILFLNADIMELAREIINRAKGFYKVQALKSFNPLFWIEFFVFLPKELLEYFGINEEAKVGSIIIKIFQVFYWIASIFFMYQAYLKSVK
jgi:hypothetical protein